MQQITKLTPAADFVLQIEYAIREYTTRDSRTLDALNKIIAYCQFLKRPLELFMFIPCGTDGLPLKEPTKPHTCSSENAGEYWEKYYQDFDAYKAAKARCLFEGFEIIDWGNSSPITKTVCYEKVVHPFHFDSIEKSWKPAIGKKTIEDFVFAQFPLTPTALKEIYGS